MGPSLSRCCAGLLAASLAAPAPAQQPSPGAVFETEVTLVAVPVFVFDKSGKAVPGLVASDFEIEEQGRKVPIRAFEAIDADEEIEAPGSGTPSVIQAAARRQFVFLFDLQFATPAGIVRARSAAFKFIEQSMAPNDLAAVATYGRAGLKVLTPLTPDRSQTARAVLGLGLTETMEIERDPLGFIGSERDPLASPIGSDLPDPSLDPSGNLADRIESQRDRNFLNGMQFYQQRVYDYVDQLRELARVLGAARGRKQLLLFSAGFDPATWRVRFWDSGGDVVIRSKMDELFRELAASDTVVHALDVTGLETNISVSGGARAASQGRDSLAALTLNSGGRLIKDTNDLGRGLREVFDASRYYYVLGFEPTDPERARKRLTKLKVRVLREGLSVSHRAGYVLPDPKFADANTRRVQASEAIAKGLSGGPLVLRTIALPYRAADGGLAVSAVLELDARSLLQPAPAGELKLEIFGYALSKGRVLDGMALSPTLSVAKLGERLRRSGIQVLTSFGVTEGPVDLRFFVRDAAAPERWGATRFALGVPSFGDSDFRALPPLVMEDPSSRVVIPFASRGRPLELPFRVGATRFVPQALPLLTAGEPREVCALVWRGGRRDDRWPLEVAAELLEATGSKRSLRLAGDPRVTHDADGFERYVVSVVVPADVRGDQTLRLSFRDPEAAAVAQSEAIVEVR
jgi:VWFA-related protein